MTTIRFNKDRDIKNVITICCFGVGGMICAVLISYVCLVGTKYDLASVRSSLESMEIENAELKNEYFQLTNAESLEKLAGEMGLVQDKNPEWVLASQS
jgi:hypothetical protein